MSKDNKVKNENLFSISINFSLFFPMKKPLILHCQFGFDILLFQSLIS